MGAKEAGLIGVGVIGTIMVFGTNTFIWWCGVGCKERKINKFLK
jgi:hypothetical protein